MESPTLATSCIALQASLTTALRHAERSISHVNLGGREFLDVCNELSSVRLLLGGIIRDQPLIESEALIMQSLQPLSQIIDNINGILDTIRAEPLRPNTRLLWVSRRDRIRKHLDELRNKKERLTLVLAIINVRQTATAQLGSNTTLHSLQQLEYTARPERSFSLEPISASSTNFNLGRDAKTLQDNKPAVDWLNQIVALKKAALEAEEIAEWTLKSSRSLKDFCGLCSFWFRTVKSSNSTLPSLIYNNMSLCYIWPSWIASRMLIIEYNDHGVSSLGLRSLKIVPSREFMFFKSTNVEVLREALVELKISIFDVDEEGRTLLWHTVSFESLDVCDFLLQSGADPLFESPVTRESPIKAAWNLVLHHEEKYTAQALRMIDLFSSFTDLNQSMVSSKLAEDNSVSTKDEMQAEDEECTFYDALARQTNSSSDDAASFHDTGVMHGASRVIHGSDAAISDTLDSQARTPLSNAAAIDDFKAIVTLLSYGADASIADVAGWTPLHVASHEGNLKAAESLLASAKARLTTFTKQTPKDDAGALTHGSTSNVDTRDNIGRTPLSIAIRSQQTDIALLLIHYGANIDLRDYYGRSPIFHAVIYNNDSVIDALLERNCNVVFAGKDGGTVLHTAAAYATSSTLTKLTSRLPYLPVQCLPDTMAVDEQGRSALACAYEAFEITDKPPYTIIDFELLLAVIERRQKLRDSRTVQPRTRPLSKSLLEMNIAMLSFPVIIIIGVIVELDPWGKGTTTLRKILSGVFIWLVSLICLSMLLKRLGFFFFWKRMVGIMRQTVLECSLSKKGRVQWFCPCGQHLVDHFVELKPGAAANLQNRLRNTALVHHIQEEQQGPSPLPRATTGPTNDSSIDSESSQSFNTDYVNAAQQPTYAAPPSTLPASETTSNLSSTPVQAQSDGQGAPTQQYNASHVNAEVQDSPAPLPPLQEPKWLLICSRPHKLPTSLTHLDTRPVFNDKALFRNIRLAYHDQKSSWHSWLSLKGITAINFVRVRREPLIITRRSESPSHTVQFSVHHRDFVDIHSPVPSIPPLTEIHNYDYVPYDPDPLPPIGEERMTHLFHHPEHADNRAEITQQVPKKRNRQIDASDPPTHRQGWGIHVVEGLMPERLLFLLTMVFAGASLTFGICWSILKHDVGGAWTVSAWMSTLGALIIAFAQYMVN